MKNLEPDDGGFTILVAPSEYKAVLYRLSDEGRGSYSYSAEIKQPEFQFDDATIIQLAKENVQSRK
jgi:hypothetical protein